MKSIRITGLIPPDEKSVYTDRLKYKVILGNGIIRTFTSLSDSKKFLSQVSRFLSYKMHECNTLYTDVFTQYRRAWFYFDHNKPGGRDRSNMLDKDRLCQSNITQIADIFNILYKRSDWGNGNHFVFVHFANITRMLLEITDVLAFVYENKSAAAVQYEIEILTTKIKYCRRTIDNYTRELENEFTDQEITPLSIVHSA